MQKTIHQTYSFGEFTLDLTRGCLLRGSTEVKLRPKSYEVLRYMAENGGRLIGKDELIEVVWQGMAVTDDSLVQCLKDIRNALDDKDQAYIKTVPRRGYIFEKDIRENGAAGYFEETTGVHVVIEEQLGSNGDGELTRGPPRTAIHRRSLIGLVKRHRVLTALGLLSLLFAGTGIAYGVFLFLKKPAGPPFRSVSIRRLTTDGQAELAAVSPDGNYIAYQMNEPGGTESLWIRQVAAVNPKRIVEPADVVYTSITFSPDGNLVYFVHGGVLFQVHTLGGATRKVWDGVNSTVTFSPDGKSVAFVRKRQGASRLIVGNADGTGEPREVTVREGPEYFAWSDVDGCAWSPDGETIVCVGGNNGGFGQMYPIAIRVADGAQSPLTQKRWNYAKQVAWLSDGSGLLMCAGDLFESRVQMWHISFPDGNPTRIYSDFNRYEGVSLTTAADALVSVQGVEHSNIYSIDPNEQPQNTRAITTGPDRIDGGFAFTPDGKMIIETQYGGTRDLWEMDTDGSNQKQLTFDALMETMVRVSPDGRSIIFVSNPGIWKIDRDGSNRRQLSERGMFPIFSPDGEWILFTEPGDKWTLWKMRADGTDPQRITALTAVTPRISPDGKMIAYVARPRQPEPAITIIPIDGGEPIKMLPIPPLPARFKIEWAPDGKSITYPRINKGIEQIVNQPVDGGEPVIVLEAKSEDGQIGPFQWSPDGTKLFYTWGPISRNVVMFNLER
jgi:Tol biopolymer transport system component/DNA-binding winged helix-turn-helix (wHTH) protein